MPTEQAPWLPLLAMRFILKYLIIIVLCTSFSACFRFRMSDKAAVKMFGKLSPTFQINRYISGNRTLRSLEIGSDSLPIVLFIHGGLGTAWGFNKYLKDSALLKHFKMIAIDRPGHGYSDFGKTTVSVEKQAQLVLPLLQKMKASGQKIIIVGHSYGGTLAARIAMDYPDIADVLVLSCAAIDAESEGKLGFTKPLDFWAIRWMMPKNFIIANDEKIAHANECRQMLPFWSKIHVPTVYIHGRNDKIVPFTNAAFAKKQLTNAPSVKFVLKDDLPHIYYMSNIDLIKNELLELKF
jgi:pimeloyl-ACP methyl ester carboxylesterase